MAKDTSQTTGMMKSGVVWADPTRENGLATFVGIVALIFIMSLT
jgi:hypothetical protein